METTGSADTVAQNIRVGDCWGFHALRFYSTGAYGGLVSGFWRCFIGFLRPLERFAADT